jgi:hypothetical protein
MSLNNDFIKYLKDKNFNEAANVVEDYSKKLVNKGQNISTSSLNKLYECVSKAEKATKIEKVFLKSEILSLKLGLTNEELSNVIADLIMECDEREIQNLSLLMKTLLNFYRFYSGGEKNEL